MKKEKNMDEYKPTARQLVTIKGLHIFNASRALLPLQQKFSFDSYSSP